MSKTSTACRACLVDNLTMYSVTNSPYEEVYEKLSNAKLCKGNLPETFCYICLNMLKKFKKFAALTQESNVMLEQWYKNEIDCKPKKHQQFKISTTSVEYITSNITYPEPSKEIKVKIEPDDAELLNQVQFVEFTNESDPYAAPEEIVDLNVDDSQVKDNDSFTDAEPKPGTPSDDEFEVPIVKLESRKRVKTEKTPKGTPGTKKRKTSGTTSSRLNTPNKRPSIPDINDGIVNKNNDPSAKQTGASEKKYGIAKKIKYSCDYCDHVSYVESLKSHLKKVHSDKEPITCDFCDYEALNKGLLESHVSRYHKEGKEFVCYVCEYTSASKSEFVEHQKMHTGMKAFSCRLCDSKFTGKVSLRTHFETVHKGEFPEATDINIDYDVNDVIERIIPNEFPYSCDQCDYKCGFQFEIEYHRFIHDAKWPFVCPMCEYKTPLKERVRDHLMSHYDEKQYYCKLCGLQSLYKNSLQLHVRGTHFGEKPISCDECDFKCLEKRNLKRHYLTQHSNKEKSFLCHICDKKFAIKEGLALHLKIHKGDKKFTCTTCGYKAQRKGTLVNHMRTHTGEKPYACHLCERRFAQKSALNTHAKRHVNQN